MALLLEDLNSFVQLAKTGNFSRAAKRLGITPSSLTRRIQALESELGYTLLQRTTRSTMLTEQGKRVLLRADSLLQQAAELKDELADRSREMAGLVRVGAPVDLAITVLGPALAAFCREHPTLSLNLIATQGQPDLQKDQLDVAFVIVHQRPMADSTYTLSRIGSFPRLLFASRDYLAKAVNLQSPSDLSAHSCVLHLRDRPDTHWELRGESRCARVPVKGTCATTSLTIAAQAARASLGIAMLPVHLARSVSGEPLVRVLPEWEGAPALIFAVTSRNHRLARLSALINWMRTHVPERLSMLEHAQ